METLMTATAAKPHTAAFEASWRSFDGIHGGLVVASMMRAAADATGAVPAAVSAHLDRPIPPGPANLTVDDAHGGRTVSCHVTLDSSATALVRLVRDNGPTVLSTSSVAPALDDPSTLPQLEIPVDFVPFSQHLDIRPINAARPFAGGESPEFDVWIRLHADLDFTTVERSAVLLDALPPGLFATFTMPVAIPTVEFSAHFAPTTDTDSPWHRLRHRTVWSTETLCVDETELFTATGELAAQARQLRRILR
jgi:acyl-CoA thioesterase